VASDGSRTVQAVYAGDEVHFWCASHLSGLCNYSAARDPRASRHSGLRSFSGEPPAGCCFATRPALIGARVLQLHGIRVREADIRHVKRVLMERFITGGVRASGIRVIAMAIGSCRRRRWSRAIIARRSPSLVDVECSMSGELYSWRCRGRGVMAGRWRR
jgi:hypothetical protein